MSDIKRLLNKKGWTGRELGQIELANTAYMFSQQIQGKDPTPLVTQGEFRKMLNTLKDPIQGGIYNNYIKIHEWLSIAYNITSGQEQQAQSNFKTLLNHITVAQALEKTYAYIDKLPVIMTEKQYKDYVEKHTEEDGQRRAILNGIAILQQSTFNSHTIDEKGYYKAPNVLQGLTPLSLGALFTDYPDYASTAEGVETARENLIDSYYFMLGFNMAIDLIAQYYNVPQLEVFKFDTARMADRMEAFNDLSDMMYKEIKERQHEDKELQAKKLKVLKDFFYPIGYEELVIPQENIDKTIELFKDGGAFEDAKITDLLCTRYEEGGRA